VPQALELARFEEFLESLPQNRRSQLDRDWPAKIIQNIPVAGIQLGKRVLLGSSRLGVSRAITAIYHSPTLRHRPHTCILLWVRKLFEQTQ